MKIELGKTYLDRDGVEWMIKENLGYSDDPYQGYNKEFNQYRNYDENGKCFFPYQTLVKEILY